MKKINLVIIFLVAGCRLPVASCYAQAARYVRVAVVQDAASLSLRINGPYEIIDPVSKNTLQRQENLKTTVTSYKGAIMLGGRSFELSRILIAAEPKSTIVLNNKKFRGSIQLIKKDNGRLLAVNEIGLEDYIKGILYHESSHYWPMEALKAQAVACRSFAFYQMNEIAARGYYDVTSDIYSQVYGGMTSERYRTNEAVDETAGEVLVFEGKVLPAYFHATCAGHTEDARVLWNTDMAPLKGTPCFFCKDSPHYKWHVVLLLDEIRDKMIAAGYKIKAVKKIEALDKNKSGRVVNLRIATENKDMDIPAKDFRNAISPNVIRSTNFTLEIAGDEVAFEGLGWGHGVGLCQWGAYFMAKRGYNYKRILEYYYPQSALSDIE